jgi:hypothetical protein
VSGEREGGSEREGRGERGERESKRKINFLFKKVFLE